MPQKKAVMSYIVAGRCYAVMPSQLVKLTNIQTTVKSHFLGNMKLDAVCYSKISVKFFLPGYCHEKTFT